MSPIQAMSVNLGIMSTPGIVINGWASASASPSPSRATRTQRRLVDDRLDQPRWVEARGHPVGRVGAHERPSSVRYPAYAAMWGRRGYAR